MNKWTVPSDTPASAAISLIVTLRFIIFILRTSHNPCIIHCIIFLCMIPSSFILFSIYQARSCNLPQNFIANQHSNSIKSQNTLLHCCSKYSGSSLPAPLLRRNTLLSPQAHRKNCTAHGDTIHGADRTENFCCPSTFRQKG